MAFDHAEWNEHFINNPGYNDAKKYGVEINPVSNSEWKVIGVHHLSGEENVGKHHVFCDILDEENQRVDRARLKLIQGHLSPVYATIDKPAYEPGTNFPMWGVMPSVVWVDTPMNKPLTSESVSGLRANHADEESGNTIGHHSFYVVWKKGDGVIVDPPPLDGEDGIILFETPIFIEDVIRIEKDGKIYHDYISQIGRIIYSG